MKVKRDYISIVISAYNEEENIEKLYEDLCIILKEINGTKYELVFVNDGSTDKTKDKILQLLYNDSNVKLVDLVRNFGHELAMTAGMDYSCGKCVIFMDADLQHPPELISEMVNYWQNGIDVVLTKRTDNFQESRISKWKAVSK